MEQLLGLPPDGSAHGPAIDSLIGLVHWLMLVLFVGWGAFYVLVLFRFRKSKNPQANYTGVKNHISTYLEAGVLVIEVLLLAVFSVPLWSKRVDAFPDQKEATVVRVVAEQFAWNVHYAGPDGKFGKTSLSLIDAENPLGLDRNDPDAKDDITTINQLNLPVNKPVIVYLSTKDVIHSFNLPVYRMKQDAIPGMVIPLWFTPTKTTEMIRDELKRKLSISEAMKKARMIVLPAIEAVRVQKGSSADDMVAMRDVADSQGGGIISKGDRLTAENMGKLADAGIPEVPARRMAAMDKYVVMDDYKDTSGAVAVGKSSSLTEDAVTKLIEMAVKQVPARQASGMDAFVLMDAYNDKTGNPIGAKGDPMSEDMVTKLSEAGISEVMAAPATPTEIACAQLCGLGHYRMRGYITVQTPEDFQKWIDDQEAALAPPPSTPADTSAQAPPPGE